jgi:hypothetical protein
MRKDSRIDSPLKTGVFSGICLAAAAIVGLQAVVPAVPAIRRAAPEVIRAASVAGNSAFDLGGIVAMAGASVLVMAWLHRQSLRSLVLARRPAFRAIEPQTGSHIQRRSAVFSFRSGGLYGP